ncbi:MAG TPA: hypothetical protein VIY51_08695 [Xanthobacteraceae bacterium]
MRGLLGAIVVAVLASPLLAGCSDIYFDRRDTVALGAEDHLDTNRVAQMIDPWPRDVTRRQIAFDGQKMQSAVERYRTNRVIPPVNVTTSSAAYQQAEQAAATTLNSTNQQSAPAAPVK